MSHIIITEQHDYSLYIEAQDHLPPIGVVVEAVCRKKIIWLEMVGEYNRFKEEAFSVRRIKSDSTKGWQWSHAEIDTYFTWDVIYWRFVPEKQFNQKAMQLQLF